MEVPFLILASCRAAACDFSSKDKNKMTMLKVALAVVLGGSMGSGEVRITELSGASSDRLLKYSETGQPSLGPGTPWFAPSFEDSSWELGPAPLGFGGTGLGTDLSAELAGVAPSFYLRKRFEVSAAQAASVSDLILDTRFADGIVVYLNGVEVERCNLGPKDLFVYSDQFAFRANPSAGEILSLNLGRCADLLTEGENVIAVQVAGQNLVGPLRFEGLLRIDAAITLYSVVSDTFPYANGASKVHRNVLGVIGDETLGSPISGGWLDRSPSVTSGAAWDDLEVITLSDAGAGEAGDGGISYTVTATGTSDEAVISFPPVAMNPHWEAGSVTAGDLAGTELSFRFKGDPDTAYDFVVQSPDGEVTAAGFPLVVTEAQETVGYWRFDDEGAADGELIATAADSSGNGRSASPSGNGAGNYSTDVPGEVIFDPLANATRRNDFSMDVSGSGRRLQVPNDPALNTSFTAEMFIKIDEEPAGYNPFMRRQASSTSRWQIDFDHNSSGPFGRLRARIDTPDGLNNNFVVGPLGRGNVPENQRIWIDTDSGNGLVSGYNDPSDWARDGDGLNDRPGWHHVAVTLDEETGVVRFFYDYQLIQTRTLSGVTQSGYSHPSGILEFGKFDTQYAMLIDEVRLTGRVLESDEFLQVAGGTTGRWTTYEVNLGQADPVERAALLAHLNARNEMSFVPGLRVREESYSPEGRTLTLDQFSVNFADGVGGNLLVSGGDNWHYHPGTAEPSGGVYESGAIEGGRAEFVDWIELGNEGAEAVDLTGWSLSDDAARPRKWTFPDGTTIPANGYLLVLADELDPSGLETEYLHANFKLSRDGEYLALVDAAGQFRTEFVNGFAPQRDFASFGERPEGVGFVYFEEPTPGRANGGAFEAGLAEKPTFGLPGGFHATTVSVSMATVTPGAIIRYTTDGSEPTLTNGTTYTSPLLLSRINSRTGHIIRARAFATGLLPSETRSATYLIGQSANLTSAPALLFSGDEDRTFYRPFGILAIQGGRNFGTSWEAVGKDDYNIPLFRGQVYERPLFVEFYQANSTNGFGVNGGIRVASSNFARPRLILNGIESSPWQTNARDKPSFNLYFRNRYERSSIQFPVFGPEYRGNTFEQLRPRAGKRHEQSPHQGRGDATALPRNGAGGLARGFQQPLCERRMEGVLQSLRETSGALFSVALSRFGRLGHPAGRQPQSLPGRGRQRGVGRAQQPLAVLQRQQ